MCYYFKLSVTYNTLSLLDTVIDSRLEATRVLSTSSLPLTATGISTSAYISCLTGNEQVPNMTKNTKQVILSEIITWAKTEPLLWILSRMQTREGISLRHLFGQVEIDPFDWASVLRTHFPKRNWKCVHPVWKTAL